MTDPVDLLARTPTRLLIAGRWVDAADGGAFDVRNPATGGVLARVASATPDDGRRALDAAVAAQDAWAATAPRIRSDILRRAWELVQERRDDLALLMTLEMGKPLAQADGEVTYGGEFLRWFAEEAVRIPGRYGPLPEGTGTAVVTHRPVGPCYLVTPWNFPLAMATRKIAPALAAGCTVVLKPAELTPLTSLYLGQLLLEAGLPAGVVNIVPTSHSAALSEPLLGDPRLRKLSFTGSTPVGRLLLAQAAGTVLRTSMELGGNAPFLVFPDADLDAAVEGALVAKFRNIGQACTAANRFLVHEDVAEEFAARLETAIRGMRVGDGRDAATDIGPLIDDRAVAAMDELVRDARDRGAAVRVGGEPLDGPGCFYPPTLVTGLPADARMAREEIFGPVLAITTFRDDAEAIRLANDTEYGLMAYAYTRDLARAHRLIDAIDAGMMAVNAGVASNAAAPFGGVKQSGLGREGGAEGIHEFLEVKYTLLGA